MDLHGATTDAGREQVILELLIDGGEDGDPQHVNGVLECCHHYRHKDTNVGSHSRDELACDSGQHANR